MGDVVSRGVGAVLSVNGNTRKMQEFMGEIPTSISTPIDPDRMHLTLLDFDETMVPITSVRDSIALEKTAHAITNYLGGLPLGEIVLRPEEERLKVFGRFLGIVVSNSELLLQAREKMEEIARKNLGLEIDDENFIPHISVARITNRRKNLRLENFAPPIPPNIHVTGYDIGQRKKGYNVRRPSKKQSYANRPKALRH